MTGRRDFLVFGAGAFLASLLPGRTLASAGHIVRFSPRRITVKCGLGKPVSFLHLSDSHLALMTKTELRNPRRAKLYANRIATWQSKYAEEGLAAALAYAKERRLPIVHTGDLIDYISEANVKAVRRFASESKGYLIAGNHEWAYYMFTGNDNLPLMKETHIARLSEAYGCDLEADARIIGGVNFVSFDDWNYQVSEYQDNFMRKEFEKGLPTVLLCHCPFYSPKLHASEIKRRTDRGVAPATGLIGTPPDVFADLVKSNPQEKWRAPTKRTAEFIEWVLSRRNLKAVFAGHLHRYHQEEIAPGVMQYVVDTTSSGRGYDVTLT